MILESLPKSMLAHKRIGFFHGSFDPLHKGHESVVEQLLEKKLVDYVLLYPCWGGDQFKQRTNVALRSKMLLSLYAKHPMVIVTQMPPVALQNYLTEPATALVDGKPSVRVATPGTQYIGILGSDAICQHTALARKKLKRFMQGIQIPEQYHYHTGGGLIALPAEKMIVFLRNSAKPGSIPPSIGNKKVMAVINSNAPKISSSMVRATATKKEAINDLVSQPVGAVIEKYQLYRKRIRPSKLKGK